MMPFKSSGQNAQKQHIDAAMAGTDIEGYVPANRNGPDHSTAYDQSKVIRE